SHSSMSSCTVVPHFSARCRSRATRGGGRPEYSIGTGTAERDDPFRLFFVLAGIQPDKREPYHSLQDGAAGHRSSRCSGQPARRGGLRDGGESRPRRQKVSRSRRAPPPSFPVGLPAAAQIRGTKGHTKSGARTSVTVLS